MTIITPYDNSIAIWQHTGDSVKAASIDELAQYIRRVAPAVSQVWVKTSDGSDWMAAYDHKVALAIDGPAAIARWITTLQKYGLEFHAWCVPRGLDIEGEAAVISKACQVPGVRSMILDVEPYHGFYQGDRTTVRPLMSKIRSTLPGAFHIGMAVDPRASHYPEIFPDEWFPFVNSVHLELYWGDFGVTPDVALANGYHAWKNFNRPLFPILQGHGVDASSVAQARTLAVNTYKSTGISWWVLSDIQSAEFAPINHYVNGDAGVTPPGTDGGSVSYGNPIVVTVGSPNYADGVFAGVNPPDNTFSTYPSAAGGNGKFHASNDHVSQVWARWDPQIKHNGWYRIEAFIPNQHATSGKVRYKIHGVKDRSGEVIQTVPQHYYNNEWAVIGTYQIDSTAAEAGVVYLDNWTFEPGAELAFDALRWRSVTATVSTSSTLISGITQNAHDIFARGKSLGNRANVFSRVGDSISASPYFLTPIGEGQYDLGLYNNELAVIVSYFSQANARTGNSFANAPLAAGNGWGADRIIQPGYAYTDICGNEMPLVCEYERVKPAVALIMIGTNDSGGIAPELYTANLHRILDISIERGILPVLSTIPPKLNDAWNSQRADQWNGIIRDTAHQYDIPLWDYWYALQGLPNKGLGPDGIHPSIPPDNATGHFTTTNLQYGYTMRNLTALQVLNAIRQQVIG